EESRRADPHHPGSAELRGLREKRSGGTRIRRGPGCQGQGQGPDLAQSEFGWDRPVSPGALGTELADPTGGEPALLARQTAVRACGVAPYSRQCRAASVIATR